MSGSWTKGKDQFFLCETWSVNYEWYWEIAIWSCPDTLDFRLRAEEMFCMKILFNIAKVSWENSNLFWRHQNFSSREEDVHVHSPLLPPFMNEVLSEERQLMKWVGRFQFGNFLGGNFPGGDFPRGSLMGENFPGGNFPGGGGNFPRTVLQSSEYASGIQIENTDIL